MTNGEPPITLEESTRQRVRSQVRKLPEAERSKAAAACRVGEKLACAYTGFMDDVINIHVDSMVMETTERYEGHGSFVQDMSEMLRRECNLPSASPQMPAADLRAGEALAMSTRERDVLRMLNTGLFANLAGGRARRRKKRNSWKRGSRESLLKRRKKLLRALRQRSKAGPVREPAAEPSCSDALRLLQDRVSFLEKRVIQTAGAEKRSRVIEARQKIQVEENRREAEQAERLEPELAAKRIRLEADVKRLGRAVMESLPRSSTAALEAGGVPEVAAAMGRLGRSFFVYSTSLMAHKTRLVLGGYGSTVLSGIRATAGKVGETMKWALSMVPKLFSKFFRMLSESGEKLGKMGEYANRLVSNLVGGGEESDSAGRTYKSRAMAAAFLRRAQSVREAVQEASRLEGGGLMGTVLGSVVGFVPKLLRLVFRSLKWLMNAVSDILLTKLKTYSLGTLSLAASAFAFFVVTKYCALFNPESKEEKDTQTEEDEKNVQELQNLLKKKLKQSQGNRQQNGVSWKLSWQSAEILKRGVQSLSNLHDNKKLSIQSLSVVEQMADYVQSILPDEIRIALALGQSLDSQGGCVSEWCKTKLWEYFRIICKKFIETITLGYLPKRLLDMLEGTAVLDTAFDFVSTFAKNGVQAFFSQQEKIEETLNVAQNAGKAVGGTATTGWTDSLFDLFRSITVWIVKNTSSISQFSIIKSINIPMVSMISNNFHEFKLARCLLTNMFNDCGAAAAAAGAAAIAGAGTIWYFLASSLGKEEKAGEYAESNRETFTDTSLKSAAERESGFQFLSAGGPPPRLGPLKARIVALGEHGRPLRLWFNDAARRAIALRRSRSDVGVDREPVAYYGLGDI